QRHSTSNLAESIAERLRSGQRVSLDEVYSTSVRPWMSGLSPLFDRMRTAEQKQSGDLLIGEMTRNYNLDQAQKERLKKWLNQKTEEKSGRLEKVLNDPSSGFVDFAKAMEDHENRWDDVEGFDEFMATTLEGETLEAFQNDRLAERAERVQNEAEGKMQRIDSMVDLDEEQKDRVFALMARSSEHFDPSMQFEGLEADSSPLEPGREQVQAFNEILRPEQSSALERAMNERLEEARKGFHELGLNPPKGWEELEDPGF
ncbi:MAG: hypothetical protein AAF514_10540, partial [Verrucomicrobiota bacterium]